MLTTRISVAGRARSILVRSQKTRILKGKHRTSSTDETLGGVVTDSKSPRKMSKSPVSVDGRTGRHRTDNLMPPWR
jgi:hypothetical protein